jgi:hypothetical protein
MIDRTYIPLKKIDSCLKRDGIVMKRIRCNQDKLYDSLLSYAIERWVRKVSDISNTPVDWHIDEDCGVCVILIKAFGEIAFVELTMDKFENELDEMRNTFPEILPSG